MTIRPVLTVALVATLAPAAWSAAPVEEAGLSDSPVAATTVATNGDADEDGDAASGVEALYYQLQVLQDDVRRLQGIVEEQNYRIDRLIRGQRERYVELDQRLVALRRGTSGVVDPATTGESAVAATPAPDALGSQGDAYNRAFAVVTAARQLAPSERIAEYERALTLFDALINDNPAGEFTPNAYYWIGELYLAMDDLEQARQAFVQVPNLYGDHIKMPDALYKLGITYHRLGDNARALEYLDQVVRDYPDHTAAGLARSYATELR